MWKKTILGLALIAGLVAAAGSPTVAQSSAQPVSGAAALVRTAPVRAVDDAERRRYTGQLRAQERARLGFAAGGRVAQRFVRLGQRVAKGQVLARLDPAPLHHAVAAATARNERARAELEQQERVASRSDLLARAHALAEADREDAHARADAVRAGREAARIQLKEARRLLADATLRAPFDAVVSEVLFEPGERVAPGAPVLVLSGDGDFEVEIEVPEHVLVELRVGTPATVELPLARRAPLTGEVIGIGRPAPERGGLFPVLVRVPKSPDLMSGMTADVVFELEQRPALSVPIEAVRNPDGGSPTIFVVEDGVARTRTVEVVRILGSRAVFLAADVREQDSVIVSGHAAVVAEQPVEVVP